MRVYTSRSHSISLLVLDHNINVRFLHQNFHHFTANFSFINLISDAFEKDFTEVFPARLCDYAASTAFKDISIPPSLNLPLCQTKLNSSRRVR